jgi:hypothetical protein
VSLRGFLMMVFIFVVSSCANALNDNASVVNDIAKNVAHMMKIFRKTNYRL